MVCAAFSLELYYRRGKRTCEVIQDQQVEFVELGNGGFESELATGNLQTLNEICGAGEQHAPAAFDESEAESCARWLLPPPGDPNNSKIGAVVHAASRFSLSPASNASKARG
jgi:hypothetical protein